MYYEARNYEDTHDDGYSDAGTNNSDEGKRRLLLCQEYCLYRHEILDGGKDALSWKKDWALRTGG